jgi:hypothetical protein
MTLVNLSQNSLKMIFLKSSPKTDETFGKGNFL